jgi:hypothetical protein
MIYYQTRNILIIVLFTAIAACSFKTIYNNLDELIPEYVEDMVTLDDVLEQKFEQRTQLLLDWHRNTQLHQYADWMRSVQLDIGQQLTAEKVEQRIDEIEQFWQVISSRMNDEMAQLLPLLNEQQQQELFSNLAESNADFREEYIDIDEADRREQYYEDLYETYESWIGALSDEQDDAINKTAQVLVSTAELRLQRRIDWQNGIQEILSSADDIKNKSLRLRKFLAGFENSVNKAMQEKSDFNRNSIVQLTVQISHNMSQKQKDFFISRTDEYIRIFTELAEKSESAL